MARRYGTFTPKRRAALKRASLISAAKRRGIKKRHVAIGVLSVGAGAGVVAGVKVHNKHFDPTFNPSPYHYIRYSQKYRKDDAVHAALARSRKQSRRIMKQTSYSHQIKKINRGATRITRPNGSRIAMSYGMAIMHSRQRRRR